MTNYEIVTRKTRTVADTDISTTLADIAANNEEVIRIKPVE